MRNEEGRKKQKWRIKSRMRFGHTELNRTLFMIMMILSDKQGDVAAPHSQRWNRFDSNVKSVRNKTAGQETSRCQNVKLVQKVKDWGLSWAGYGTFIRMGGLPLAVSVSTCPGVPGRGRVWGASTCPCRQQLLVLLGGDVPPCWNRLEGPEPEFVILKVPRLNSNFTDIHSFIQINHFPRKKRLRFQMWEEVF